MVWHFFGQRAPVYARNIESVYGKGDGVVRSDGVYEAVYGIREMHRLHRKHCRSLQRNELHRHLCRKRKRRNNVPTHFPEKPAKSPQNRKSEMRIAVGPWQGLDFWRDFCNPVPPVDGCRLLPGRGFGTDPGFPWFADGLMYCEGHRLGVVDGNEYDDSKTDGHTPH